MISRCSSNFDIGFSDLGFSKSFYLMFDCSICKVLCTVEDSNTQCIYFDDWKK